MQEGCSSPVLARLHALVEGRVDVLDQDKAAVNRVGEQMVELVVAEAALREIEQADVVIQRARERLDER